MLFIDKDHIQRTTSISFMGLLKRAVMFLFLPGILDLPLPSLPFLLKLIRTARSFHYWPIQRPLSQGFRESMITNIGCRMSQEERSWVILLENLFPIEGF